MKNVLADLAVESEAATALGLRLARAYDVQADEHDPDAAPGVDTGSEILGMQARRTSPRRPWRSIGGNGYVEESMLPRIYRRCHSIQSGKAPAT